jgi:hypothetical protein
VWAKTSPGNSTKLLSEPTNVLYADSDTWIHSISHTHWTALQSARDRWQCRLGQVQQARTLSSTTDLQAHTTQYWCMTEMCVLQVRWDRRVPHAGQVRVPVPRQRYDALRSFCAYRAHSSLRASMRASFADPQNVAFTCVGSWVHHNKIPGACADAGLNSAVQLKALVRAQSPPVSSCMICHF